MTIFRRSEPRVPLAERDWEAWADGHVHRLSSPQDFAGDPADAVSEAERAAARMGKAVRTIVDPLPPHTFVWLQFADYTLPPKTPCLCGGRRFERPHPDFAMCLSCGRTALLVKTGSSVVPLTSLDAYTQVTIFNTRRRADGAEDIEYGHALDPHGRPVLVSVHFPLEAGNRVPDPGAVDRPADDRARNRHTVRYWHVQPFALGIDLDAFGGHRVDEPHE